MFICSRRAPRSLHHLSSRYRRCITTQALAGLLQQPVQSYISTSDDPYLNLSIENHLLRNTPPESAILFLYVNRPSIVIGRNQNPWLEVNLPLLRESSNAVGNIELVRRRSGGGTVFHDQGNVNWTVIVHPSGFTRDKHVDMIVRALKDRGVDAARGNARHDVVMDDHSRTDGKPVKISGSAYKLTRNRALHHGTCLLSSPHLSQISQYLRSPAKRFITAKGVESVSSPIANVGLTNEDFMQAVQEQFDRLYLPGRNSTQHELGEHCMQIDSIRQDVEEMKSLPWIFLQTPQFSVISEQTIGSTNTPLLELDVRHGIVTHSKMVLQKSDATASHDGPHDQPLHAITDWSKVFQPEQWKSQHQKDVKQLVSWLDRIFPGLDAVD